MFMRRLVNIFGLSVFVFVILAEVFIPPLSSRALSTAIKNSLKTDEVTVSGRSLPAVLMLFGAIDRVDIETHKGMLGDLRADELVLHGEGVQMPTDVLTNRNFAITEADKLELEGVVTSDDLEEFLRRKIDKLQDAKVVITEKQVVADATPKLMGIPADIHIEGVFFVEDNKICLRLTNVKIKKILFGQDIGGDLGGVIELYDFSRLNMPLELDSATHEEGRVLLKASRHPGKTYGTGAAPKRKENTR